MSQILFIFPASLETRSNFTSEDDSGIEFSIPDKTRELHPFLMNSFGSSVRDPSRLLGTRGKELRLWKALWQKWPHISAATASERYVGVIWDIIRDLRLHKHYVISPFYGIQSIDKVFPAYRLSWEAFIPGIGSPMEFWMNELKDSMNSGEDESYWAILPEHLESFLRKACPDSNIRYLRGVVEPGLDSARTNWDKDELGELVEMFLEQNPDSIGEILRWDLPGTLGIRSSGSDFVDIHRS